MAVCFYQSLNEGSLMTNGVVTNRITGDGRFRLLNPLLLGAFAGVILIDLGEFPLYQVSAWSRNAPPSSHFFQYSPPPSMLQPDPSCPHPPQPTQGLSSISPAQGDPCVPLLGPLCYLGSLGLWIGSMATLSFQLISTYE